MAAVVGAAQLAAQFAALQAVSHVIGEVCELELKEVISEVAQGLVAVDTGETKASIEILDEGVGAGGAAIFLEFGTYKMAAQPFMRPGIDEATHHSLVPIANATLLGAL